MPQSFLNTLAVFGLPAFISTTTILRSLKVPFNQLRKRDILGKLSTWMVMFLMFSYLFGRDTENNPGFLNGFSTALIIGTGIILGYLFARFGFKPRERGSK